MDDGVVVVGAGPTGLTAGIELARRGVRVRVLDAAAAPFDGSRGKGLQPRSLELLDALGVTDRLVSLGRFDLPMRHHAPDGTHHDLHLHGEADPEPGLPWARTLMLPQWRVEQVLRERLAREGVEVEQDARVVELDQDDDAVRLHLADGRVVAARYALGADGGSSTVRHRLDVPFLGETREEVRMLLADVEVDGLDRDHWHVWGEGADFLALCPLPATPTWQLQVADPGPGRTPTEEVLRDVVDGLGPRVRLRTVHWSSTWRLNERMVQRYRVGRVLLAGDAAHVHSPAGGQGMNTGIADAVNLGWKLAAVLHGADAALLDTYEAERLPVAAEVLGLSSRLLTTPFARRADATADTSQLGVTYRGGPLAGDDAGPGPRPGDRAPDAPTREGDLLAVRRGADWTLLAVDAATPAVDARVRVVHAAPGAREIYAARAGEMILIRPDGHVGRRGTDPEALAAWLAPLLPAAATVGR